MLKILAGQSAYKQIKENGFNLSDFSMIMGASGGPKWLMLTQLDRYIMQHWLPKMNPSLQLVGSSIGAWRMAMYASKNPRQALEDFIDAYLKQSYKSDATPKEISDFIRTTFIGPVSDIDLNDTPHNLNLVTARCRGPLSINKPWVQGLAFFSSALANLFSSKTLNWFYQRITFSNNPASSVYQNLSMSNNHFATLTDENLSDALMATGAIPMVIDTIRDIKGSDRGVYIDGGMIDYHFNLPFAPDEGLILYPHFSPTLKPGWFDKMLPWRTINPKHYDRIVLILPSREFVASLPYGKIPDRKDFDNFSDQERTEYWETVLKETEALPKLLDEWWQTGKLSEQVELLTKESLAKA